ncbi:MAG: putative lipoic acid-binding regulatory protein [Pseudohongiellaceae bacterium]|jgi:putative lipoic acid-binding regulatory protein
MTSTEAHRIEFPCDYPIKAIGDSGIDFKDLVIDTVKVYAPDIEVKRVTVNPSAKGNFVSVRFFILATGKEQLELIHKALLATGRVKMVI